MRKQTLIQGYAALSTSDVADYAQGMQHCPHHTLPAFAHDHTLASPDAVAPVGAHWIYFVRSCWCCRLKVCVAAVKCVEVGRLGYCTLALAPFWRIKDRRTHPHVDVLQERQKNG